MPLFASAFFFYFSLSFFLFFSSLLIFGWTFSVFLTHWFRHFRALSVTLSSVHTSVPSLTYSPLHSFSRSSDQTFFFSFFWWILCRPFLLLLLLLVFSFRMLFFFYSTRKENIFNSPFTYHCILLLFENHQN